jgi:hypothetical protein
VGRCSIEDLTGEGCHSVDDWLLGCKHVRPSQQQEGHALKTANAEGCMSKPRTVTWGCDLFSLFTFPTTKHEPLQCQVRESKNGVHPQKNALQDFP